MFRSVLVTLLLLAVPSCAPATRAQLEQEVLHADPGFAEVLDKYRDLANRIQTYQREYALKRSAVERDIAKLRRELAAASTTVRHKTEEAKQRLQPERQRLKLDIDMAGEELRGKSAQRAMLGRSIARIKKALSRDAAWSAEERAQQDAQVEDMARDAARLDEEMRALRIHLRLLKIKLHLLQL